MNRFLTLTTMTALSLIAATSNTFAFENPDPLSKERFQIRVRGLGVFPDVDSSVNIGGKNRCW